MNLKISSIVLVALMTQACVQHKSQEETVRPVDVSDSVIVGYAEGFEVNYTGDFIRIISHSISNNSPFADTLELPTVKVGDDLAGDHLLFGHPQNIACQSSTHAAFLSALNSVNLIAGLCGMEYVQNSEINSELEKNEVVEICAAEQTDLEILQKINTDLFLIYPFETDGKAKYDAAGIRTFFIAEYLEQTALARLEWIKLIGLIIGKTKEANSYFEKTEAEYLAAVSKSKKANSKFILNLPYKESWFMPSANSMIVNLIEDAGLSYYYPSSGITENETHSTESVWNDAMFADYWIIMASRPADFSLTDLLAEEPVYKEFLSVKKNQVIFCNTATSDYFVQGVVEPQIILKDILFATNQLTGHHPKYFNLLK